MAEICFELFNNQLVQQLVGAADSNLRLIEKMLNVEILSFGINSRLKVPPAMLKALKMLLNCFIIK